MANTPVFVYKKGMRKARPPRTAKNTMMDLLARRDHSEKEMRKKLSEREFTPEQIDTAIDWGKERNWLPDSEESKKSLAERFAASLARKGKGIHYINSKLHEKGLPKVKGNSTEELEKALQLVKTKFSALLNSNKRMEKSAQGKIGRFLLSRGFDQGVVRKIIYGEHSHED